MSETANKNNERYYVRALPEAGYDSWKELGSLEEAKKYAVQNSVYGSCVADAEGNIILPRTEEPPPICCMKQNVFAIIPAIISLRMGTPP